MNIYVSLKGNKVITPTNKDQIIVGNILCLTTLWVLRRRAVNTLRNGIMTSMSQFDENVENTLFSLVEIRKDMMSSILLLNC